MARAHDDFDAFLKIRKATLKEKPNESLLLQLNATLVEQSNKKNMPVFHKYIFWVIVSLKNLVSLQSLQKHLLEHLYYDQEWLKRDEQFFLEIAFEEKQELTPISEDEKVYLFHYLAFSSDTMIILTREGFEREWNFKLNPKKQSL
ncbi:MAG: hypothetical protein NW226_04925 [Microscillaceae bacterium]|nr:hypothetical protein [Microscillaceae bacterium]